MSSDGSGDDGLRLAELIGTLSLAIDPGTGQPMEHGLRSCLLAVRLSQELGLDEQELSEVYYLALLRHLGCTADANVGAAIFGDEIASYRWFAGVELNRPTRVLQTLVRHIGEGDPPVRRARMVVNALTSVPAAMAEAIPAHCEAAQQLAVSLGLARSVQEALGQVFERWDGRGKPHGLRGEEVARFVRIVLLAHDVQHFEQFGGVETAVAMARGRAGGAHDPRIVDHFCRNAPALLSLLGQSHDWDTFLAEEPGPRPRLVASSFDRALQAIGDFVDLNAPWFGGHSRGVAELAGTAASAARLPEVEVDAIRRAGWLHDLGQIGISWSIWDKRGALTASEWERVRLHPYFAEHVLMRSPQLVALGAISGLHHERLDASGYHRGLPAALLSTTARLLAATEAFRGVSEALPHHPPRSAEAAADLLLDEVSAGRLDGEAVQAVLTAAGQARRIRRVWPAGLSEREVEVLRLVARGLSNRQMAERLSISKETVNHHVRHIYDKLGVSTRAGATVFAMQHDLLTDLLPIGK